VKMAILDEELRYVLDERARVQDHVDRLTIYAQTDGTFVLPSPHDLHGRYVKQGELLGHVVDFSTTTVRAVVRQTDVDLVRTRLLKTEVRLAERRSFPLVGRITRLAPAAGNELPSAALGTQGGGELPVDPSDEQLRKAMQAVFQVDVTLPTDTPLINAGGRVYVRFSYAWEPLVVQAHRYARQLFIRRLNV
jgi:putative peptide zinc metalloprotease protein